MSGVPNSGRLSGLPGPATTLAVFCVALLPLVLGLAFRLSPHGVGIAACVFAIGATAAVTGMANAYPHDRVGACNMVTAFRLGLASALAAAVAGPGEGFSLFAVAALALALDGADGLLARRHGLASAFGARFDMEVDALLGAVLATILLVQGRVGAEILILGFSRYAFVAAATALPWLSRPLEESLRRKAVCVLQIGTLAALLIPAVSDGPARLLSFGAAAALVWSFVRDIRWLARRR